MQKSWQSFNERKPFNAVFKTIRKKSIVNEIIIGSTFAIRKKKKIIHTKSSERPINHHFRRINPIFVALIFFPLYGNNNFWLFKLNFRHRCLEFKFNHIFFSCCMNVISVWLCVHIMMINVSVSLFFKMHMQNNIIYSIHKCTKFCRIEIE